MWNIRVAEQMQRMAAEEEAQKSEEIRREKSRAERDRRFNLHREKLRGRCIAALLTSNWNLWRGTRRLIYQISF